MLFGSKNFVSPLLVVHDELDVQIYVLSVSQCNDVNNKESKCLFSALHLTATSVFTNSGFITTPNIFHISLR